MFLEVRGQLLYNMVQEVLSYEASRVGVNNLHNVWERFRSSVHSNAFSFLVNFNHSRGFLNRGFALFWLFWLLLVDSQANNGLGFFFFLFLIGFGD